MIKAFERPWKRPRPNAISATCASLKCLLSSAASPAASGCGVDTIASASFSAARSGAGSEDVA
jgi:hypothetical protein